MSYIAKVTSHHGLNRAQEAKRTRARPTLITPPLQTYRILLISGICLLILGLIFIPLMASAQPMCPSKKLFPPRFSANLSHYMIKGCRLTPTGGEACAIRDPPQPHHECIKRASQERALAEKIFHLLGKNPSDLPDYNEKGIPGRNDKNLRVYINPQKMDNYRKALDYAQEAIVQNEQFYELSDQTILDIFKKIHQLLMNEMPLPNPAGTFRKKMMVVSELDPKQFTQALGNKIKKHATPAEIRLLKKTLRKNLDMNDLEWLRTLSEEEQKVWEKFLIICPKPEEIEGLMLASIRELKRLYHEGKSATELSSFIHGKAGHIHPFPDGNGKFAIILLQSFLKKGDADEVVIQDVETYDKKAMEDVKNPGTFLRHLEGVLIPWSERYRKELDLETEPLMTPR